MRRYRDSNAAIKHTGKAIGIVRLASALILILANAGPAWAELGTLPQLASAPTIDGVAAPGEWDDALELPLAFEVAPLWGVPIEPTATARVATSPDALLVRVSVTQTGPIKATAGKHDSSYGDGVTLRVQPDIKAQRVFELGVNAAGATLDSIGGSAGGGSPNWDGHWQSAARITDTGYTIEMRIPWSTLELAAAPEGEIALSVERRLDSGRYERQAFSPIDYRFSQRRIINLRHGFMGNAYPNCEPLANSLSFASPSSGTWCEPAFSA